MTGRLALVVVAFEGLAANTRAAEGAWGVLKTVRGAGLLTTVAGLVYLLLAVSAGIVVTLSRAGVDSAI